jgi:hypothetical protein
LLRAAKGDLSGFKSKLSDVPKEALPSIRGLEIPEGEIKASEVNNQPFEYDTKSMTVFELACVHGHSKLLSYLTDELNVKRKPFSDNEAWTPIESIEFIAAPIYKKDKATITILL